LRNIASMSDPVGARSAQGGSRNEAICASSNVTQRAWSGCSPYSSCRMPRSHSPVVWLYARTPMRRPRKSPGPNGSAVRRSRAPFWNRAASTTGSSTRSLPAARAIRKVAIAISLMSKACVRTIGAKARLMTGNASVRSSLSLNRASVCR